MLHLFLPKFAEKPDRMATEVAIDNFLAPYPSVVSARAKRLRAVLLDNLPGITEQIDLPARMIAYCYGQKYAELICVIIPSKKGLKLGFNRGTTLPDPDHLLEGTGKISRYVVIQADEPIESKSVKNLVVSAVDLYRFVCGVA